jgi:hypothetical protein
MYKRLLDTFWAIATGLILGDVSATACRMGYFHALLGTYDVPIPDTTWLWIIVTGLVMCGIILLTRVVFLRIVHEKVVSPALMLSLLAVPVLAATVVSYGAGRFAAHFAKSMQSVNVIDVTLDKPEQIAIFYRSAQNDAVGVMLDPVTHHMGHELFMTPIIHGRLNCNPSHSQIMHYIDIM